MVVLESVKKSAKENILATLGETKKTLRWCYAQSPDRMKTNAEILDHKTEQMFLERLEKLTELRNKLASSIALSKVIGNKDLIQRLTFLKKEYIDHLQNHVIYDIKNLHELHNLGKSNTFMSWDTSSMTYLPSETRIPAKAGSEEFDQVIKQYKKIFCDSLAYDLLYLSSRYALANHGRGVEQLIEELENLLKNI